MSDQPQWELIAQLGDKDPISYGGYFIYRDKTGVYTEEAEVLSDIEEDDHTISWEIYRFDLERLKVVVDEDSHISYLIPYAWDPKQEWKDTPSLYDKWFHESLHSIVEFCDRTYQQLVDDFCSKDPVDRAWAYWSVGEYWGWDNFDSYPLIIKSEEEIRERYKEELDFEK